VFLPVSRSFPDHDHGHDHYTTVFAYARVGWQLWQLQCMSSVLPLSYKEFRFRTLSSIKCTSNSHCHTEAFPLQSTRWLLFSVLTELPIGWDLSPK